MSRNYTFLIPVFAATLLLISSCGSVKHADMMILVEAQNELASIDSLPMLVVQTDDILSIVVASRNPETVVAFYHPRELSGASGERALGVQEGYRVDEQGNIYLPFLGAVKASGKTIMQLRQEISDRLVDFIPDAAIQIRFINFRVTLLGEVTRPNTYIIPNERLTILEAIGMAGDFTPYARRNSVLVIRQRDNIREFARVDVQAKEIFQSEYFFLSPNDIIYVEPLKAKQYVTQGDFVQRYSIVLVPLVSLLTFLLSRAL